jgi:hypothetical protein
MTKAIGKPDYRVRRTTDNSVRAGANAGNAGTVEFLQLLGRAVRQFHTYPAGSPLCTDAIDACHHAFMALDIDHPLTFRVTPQAIVVGDDEISGDAVIEQELARPLHYARVASIEIERGVSARDWSHFCATVAAAPRASGRSAGIAELLLDLGVAAIVPRVTPRPEVLELGAPPPAVRDLVDRERVRQSTASPAGPSQHLYPPDKGWVRIDPASADAAFSLTDLTVLVNEPAELAAILGRLIDDGDTAPGTALQQRYDDVVMLIGAVDPRLARVLFAKLAHAVLRLDADTRRSLLRSAILPSLLDGRVAGEVVLGEFPDVDLADALSLLLDLEAAAPELLPVALDRLRLPAERRAALTPLIAAKIDAHDTVGSSGDQPPPTSFDDQARVLTRVESGVARNLAEFSAFDLSINESTATALAGVRDAVAGVDGLDAQLACAMSLARIEPNPAVVSAVVTRVVPVLRGLVRSQRWQDVTRWVARIADIEAHVEALRPDAARALREAIAPFCDRSLVVDLAQLCGSEPGLSYASAIAVSLNAPLVIAWLEAVDDAADRARVRPLTGAVCQTARRAASAVVARLPTLGPDAARSALMVLGFAGAGYEKTIADHVSADDERTTREALRALARAGTEKAAALIVRRLEDGPALMQPAAEEALWRLPAPTAVTKTRELLGRRDFVTRHPQSAARLLERAAQSGDERFDPVLEQLSTLRFHFWSPALKRVGAKARDLLQ